MLVGVLISIMISIVVGVNLVPTIITSINTARAQAEAVSGFSGLGGLMEVLAYVYRKCKVPSKSNLSRITGRIRGSLSPLGYGNPELNLAFAGKGVETRGSATHVVDGIVRHSKKLEITEKIAVILLGAVSPIAASYREVCRITGRIRGNLKALAQGNPELNPAIAGKCVETMWSGSLVRA